MTGTPAEWCYGAPWKREELVLAFELYCRIPFQTTKTNNPEVKELARLLGRTPASVARKLGNFGAFDPTLKKMDIKGLTHTGKLDKEIWEEFHADWNGLVWEANLLKKNFGQTLPVPVREPVRPSSGPSETKRLTKQRVHQAFFREAVLSSYETTCCVTGLSIRECLIASHIQYGEVIAQIDAMALDSGYKGVNLLNDEDLTVKFSPDAELTVAGSLADSATLGIETLAADNADAVIVSLDAAKASLQTLSSTLSSNLGIITSRQEFTQGMINVLKDGAANLTNADMNEEGANMLMLQTRQALGTTSLSLASQTAQSVLRLF